MEKNNRFIQTGSFVIGIKQFMLNDGKYDYIVETAGNKAIRKEIVLKKIEAWLNGQNKEYQNYFDKGLEQK